MQINAYEFLLDIPHHLENNSVWSCLGPSFVLFVKETLFSVSGMANSLAFRVFAQQLWVSIIQ